MYWSGHYWGRTYWGPSYWGTGVPLTDCSGGPYVVGGYWDIGYATCDVLAFAHDFGGGGVDRRLDWGDYRVTSVTLRGGTRSGGARRGDKRFTEEESEEWFAQVDAWDAINKARREAREAQDSEPVAEVVAEQPSLSVTMTESQLRAEVEEETDEMRRRWLLALLITVNEV